MTASYLQPRGTPWVGRLIIATAAVQLLLETVLTAPGVTRVLAFDPSAVVSRPWTLVTYLFVHGGLLHLAFNMLGLWVFGSALEERIGRRAVLGLYFACGAGAALFALGLSGLWRISPFVGASGAVMGLSAAFAMLWPDTELIVFPIPLPIKAKVMVALLVGWNVLMVLLGSRDGIAYEAHIGGAVMGYLLVRFQLFGGRPTPAVPRPVPERPVLAASTPGATESAPAGAAAAPRRAPRRPERDATQQEVDRLLDKISATGLASLTDDERRFLDDQSKRKRGE
ncbi:MAG: rhomboid family intramembrane serine protease [Gemmatimonadales bacterium]|nr:rhomboid family intramembrane serine protease [Gemmatimonadales bacterium]